MASGLLSIVAIIMIYRLAIGALLFAAGCNPGVVTVLDGGGPGSPDRGQDTSPSLDAAVARRDVPGPNWDAFFANDPPAQTCGPAGSPPLPLPGGTPECPADKNREGCPCTRQGETAPCWPGLRINRNHGTCKDGVTTCMLEQEMWLRWGPCQGYVLPVAGAKGPAACGCFSKGTWEIDNTTPCFVSYPNQIYAVSTYIDCAGTVGRCPSSISATPPPAPQPGYSWSTNRLTVDCSGQFKLCYTIKAGDPLKPAAADCVVGQACTDAWYGAQNVKQELPPLPSWSSNDAACAGKFYQTGGYGEMSVVGLSVDCEKIDDGAGQPRVFLRITYCPVKCSLDPSLPECKDCVNGHSGDF
jgi:hypothetical protein